MTRNNYTRAALVSQVALLLIGCALPEGQRTSSTEQARSAGRSRIVAALMGEPVGLKVAFIQNAPAGNDAAQQLVNLGLSHIDAQGVRQPALAEVIPSVENGLWKVFPDGRMETIWKIKQQARWHDGTALTADDLLFTATVEADRELPIPRNSKYELIERVDAVDSHTVAVFWKRPFIGADAMFSIEVGLPIPKHLLEQAYRSQREGFAQLPFWTQDFIGSGPFKVREWVAGSHMVLEAHEQYVFGRPKVDEMELRFIWDSNTLLTNLLAGEVELTLGRSLSVDQAIQVRDQWRSGRVVFAMDNWVVVWPNLGDPDPAIIANLAFRRALYQAIDRQEMVNSTMGGMTPVADVYLSPSGPEYEAVKDRIVRFNYAPEEASRVLASLGYTKGSDGFLRDSRNQKLSVEIRATADNDIHHKTIFPVADYWQRLGVEVTPVLIPPQRQRDLEYRAKYPGFEMGQTTNALDKIQTWFHSSQLPTEERGFRGDNRVRYANPEFDALVDGYSATIPERDRMRLLGDVLHHVSDQCLHMPLFYLALPTMISNRIVNVGGKAPGSRNTQGWNAHEWDVK